MVKINGQTAVTCRDGIEVGATHPTLPPHSMGNKKQGNKKKETRQSSASLNVECLVLLEQRDYIPTLTVHIQVVN